MSQVLLSAIAVPCLLVLLVVVTVALRPSAAAGVAQVLRALATVLRAVMPWGYKHETTATAAARPAAKRGHALPGRAEPGP